MKKITKLITSILLFISLFSFSTDSSSAKTKLNPLDYKKNPSYTYYEKDGSKLSFNKKKGNKYYWNAYVKQKNGKYKKFTAGRDFIEIATKKEYREENYTNDIPLITNEMYKGYTKTENVISEGATQTRITKVIDTNSTLKTKARTFKHVVIIFKSFSDKYHYEEYLFYIAKGHGIIKKKNRNSKKESYHVVDRYSKIVKNK